MTTTVRLPPRVEQALAAYCVEKRRTKSEVIVELLEQRFMGTREEATPYDLAQAARFVGCVEGKAKATVGAYKDRVKAAVRAKHGK